MAKDAARRAFARIVDAGGVSGDDIVAGAERYALARQNQDPTFTKHPATWLNGGCWNDEMPVQTPTGGDNAKGWRSAGRGAFAGLNMEKQT